MFFWVLNIWLVIYTHIQLNTQKLCCIIKAYEERVKCWNTRGYRICVDIEQTSHILILWAIKWLNKIQDPIKTVEYRDSQGSW